MKDRQPVNWFEHPLALGSFRSWLRLLATNGGVERAYLLRAAFVTTTTFLTTPLRILEKLIFDPILNKIEISPPPIFIVGHWRTGTTHLHNLICQDERMGYVNTFQALAPGFCLTGEYFIKPLVRSIMHRLHPTRIIDNIPLEMDAPQEEDFAIANMTPFSFLHQYSFPCRAEELFRRFALFADITRRELREWSRAYLTVLRKALYKMPGRQLVLKSPVNSGRIPFLLDLFPDARFIHILRNPYDVFSSTLGAYLKVVPRSQLQSVTREKLEEYVINFYKKLMAKFISDSKLISPGHLIEVRFEDLEREPLDVLKHIYSALDIPDFESAVSAFRNYLQSIADYRKNTYSLSDEQIRLINREWAFAFETWGYAQRSTQ